MLFYICLPCVYVEWRFYVLHISLSMMTIIIVLLLQKTSILKCVTKFADMKIKKQNKTKFRIEFVFVFFAMSAMSSLNVIYLFLYIFLMTNFFYFTLLSPNKSTHTQIHTHTHTLVQGIHKSLLNFFFQITHKNYSSV
jgi:hypothetical protein